MSELEWAEPPADARHAPRQTKWSRIAAELRANPGKWAKVQTGVSSAAVVTRINHGIAAGFVPAGAFQGRSTFAGFDERGVGLFDVYARFVGEASA